MVLDPGNDLSNITFEDLAKALDSDPDFRAAVVRYLDGSAPRVGNQVNIETKANFTLDDARVFDLNGEGLKVTVVAVN